MDKNFLLKHARKLVREGNELLLTAKSPDASNPNYNPDWFQIDHFLNSKWSANLRNLAQMLGESSEPWKPYWIAESDKQIWVKQRLGSLESFIEALKAGVLTKIENLVLSEAFGDLLDQADHLQKQKYHLAAGVLGRAVLEEHLRKLCQRDKCVPSKPRPTISDFNQCLYAKKTINTIEMQNITLMAAIGNDAAHNKGTVKQGDVDKLLRDVREFLVRYPL